MSLTLSEKSFFSDGAEEEEIEREQDDQRAQIDACKTFHPTSELAHDNSPDMMSFQCGNAGASRRLKPSKPTGHHARRLPEAALYRRQNYARLPPRSRLSARRAP
jgi:hypothetical protein